ncbi:DUF427 domain-containing protein [Roseofilum sp. BLCC_M154]|uniref:DUF427 domain-containing protein n=1 Tax=Roseofilum acuticapitatum BLCC-M154 TaxID=3022444 RepID=A0ABT7AME1_9CYAN|nr:DUF427 domain-containing protein [Roseofilum acuticapitatum]MDJ1168060.1 DUF427 domain-containing protein [Roseofilum acuticapitatum BLCC-M154]
MYLPRPEPIPPKPGQESVWDYPRPAIWQDTNKHLKVICNGIVLAETTQGKRVLETSHPPTYYFPIEDVKTEYIIETPKKGFCEWKGIYQYYDVQIGDKYIKQAAWRCVETTPNFTELQNYYSFWANVMDACYVDDEQVTPQEGDFYAGWITADVVGPFKGGPGTRGW